MHDNPPTQCIYYKYILFYNFNQLHFQLSTILQQKKQAPQFEGLFIIRYTSKHNSNYLAIMFLRYLTLLLCLGLITGCANSVFVPYPARALSYQQALTTGTIQTALEANKKQLNSRDGLLALLEQGRMQQLAGDYTASKQSFSLALAKLDALEQRALISVSHAANQSTAK